MLQIAQTTGESLDKNNRRKNIRHQVDVRLKAHSELTALNTGTKLSAMLSDLSVDGCCLHMDHLFRAGINVPIEIFIRLLGHTLRLNGVTRWTDKKHLVGIEFLYLNERRNEMLNSIIEELDAHNLRQQAEAAAKAAALAPPAPLNSASQAALVPTPAPPEHAPTSTPASAPIDAKPKDPIEQRAHGRYQVDSRAHIRLINAGLDFHGRIEDLSQGGCRIRTDKPFTVGIYVRAEIDFYLDGLPFLLPAVVQAVHSKHSVGLRLLAMSDRKHTQLTELIQQLEKEKQFAQQDAPDAASADAQMPNADAA